MGTAWSELTKEGRAMIGVEEVEQLPLLYPRALINEARCEEALYELSVAVRMHPEWAEPWVLVSQALSLKCKFHEALTAVENALELDPFHIWGQELLTGLLLQLERREEALFASRRLVVLAPDRPEAHAFHAFAAAFSGSEHEAFAAARRCRKIAPQRGFGHQALCVVHLAFGRWEKAERHALSALAAEGPMPGVYHDLGIALFEQGRFVESRIAMTEAARIDQRYVGAMERLAKRSPRGVPTLPAIVAIAAGMAAVPLANVPLAFVAVALVGVCAFLTMAAKASGKAMTLHPDKLRPALLLVLAFDVVAALHQAGTFF